MSVNMKFSKNEVEDRQTKKNQPFIEIIFSGSCQRGKQHSKQELTSTSIGKRFCFHEGRSFKVGWRMFFLWKRWQHMLLIRKQCLCC